MARGSHHIKVGIVIVNFIGDFQKGEGLFHAFNLAIMTYYICL